MLTRSTDATFPGLAVTKIGPAAISTPTASTPSTPIGAHATNLAGATSIGDGVAGLAMSWRRARPRTTSRRRSSSSRTASRTGSPASTACIGAIDQRTFAIGLGNETQVNIAALKELANNTGGYLLLTGLLTPGTDDYFRLTKYFLQILAGVTNTDIVVDPNGYVAPGDKLRIPFVLNEADIDATVLLMEDLPVIRFAVETPDGNVIEPGDAGPLGALFGRGSNLMYYRLPLPVPIGAGAHAGTWHALLQIDKRLFKKVLGGLDNDREAFVRANALGARYSVNVHSFCESPPPRPHG